MLCWNTVGDALPTKKKKKKVEMFDPGFSNEAEQENNSGTIIKQTGHPGYTHNTHTHTHRGREVHWIAGQWLGLGDAGEEHKHMNEITHTQTSSTDISLISFGHLLRQHLSWCVITSVN